MNDIWQRYLGDIAQALHVETPNYDYFFLCTELRRKRMIPVITKIRAKTSEEFGELATALPDWSAKLWASWFQAVTPRSAGFNTLDTGALFPSTAFFIIGLMFIGGGSGSTAGGIKLGTFMVVLLATWAFLRGRERPVVFGRSIQLDIIRKSLAIIVISLLCVSTGIFLLAITESDNFLDLAFETVSAAATVGLSRGITADLSDVGQCIILVLMLIGRVGPLTIAFTLANTRGESIQYPVGQVNIG